MYFSHVTQVCLKKKICVTTTIIMQATIIPNMRPYYGKSFNGKKFFISSINYCNHNYYCFA